ncbi:MAG: methionyl-tRNA formyltransferase [Treponema sp.]|jgi:methionyl-tRNA formyltransferase|nr:methionyl-tRNA formyltransferase [Treponema sp.]
MRILFAGSPRIAVPSLSALAALVRSQTGYEIAGVLTNPDAPKGRGGRVEPTEVGSAAAALGLVVLKPERLNAEAREAVAALAPDMLVSFAYGSIFSQKFLDMFPLGGINAHPSLLPKYRGPSPIQAAILNRDAETGISIQRLAREMDSGDLLLQEAFPLTGRETAASLSEYVASRTAELLVAALRGVAEKTLVEKPQMGEVSYCALIKKEDGLIAWPLRAEAIAARIRAFTPWPQSWTMHNGEKLFILDAHPHPRPVAGGSDAAPPAGTVLGADTREGVLIQCGRGALAATMLRYQAKKALGWKAFLNGARNFIGSRLG